MQGLTKILLFIALVLPIMSALASESPKDKVSNQEPFKRRSFKTIASFAPGCLGTSCLTVNEINWSAFTEIMHFLLSPEEVLAEEKVKGVSKLMEAKPQEIKISLVIGSKGSGKGFEDLSNKEQEEFAKKLALILKRDGYSGVSIDWEENLEEEKFKTLFQAVNYEVKSLLPNATIQFSAMSSFLSPSFAEEVLAKGLAEQINLMSYFSDKPLKSYNNYGGCESYLGQFDLYNSRVNQGEDCSLQKLQKDIDYEKNSRIPADKIVAGFGIWSTSDALHGDIKIFCEDLKYAYHEGMSGAEFWAINHRKPEGRNLKFYDLISKAKEGKILDVNCSDLN